jgi:stage III sporulation protein AH
MNIKKPYIIIFAVLLICALWVGYNMFTAGQPKMESNNKSSDIKNVTENSMQISNPENSSSEITNKDNSVAQVTNDTVPVHSSQTTEVQSNTFSFFNEYRQERDNIKSKEYALWQEIINNPSSEEDLKKSAQEELDKIVALTEKEMIIENLIISRGFKDAIIFIADDSATVIVDAKGLNKENVAQIQDIVTRKTKLKPSTIKIMEKSATE